MRFGYHLSSEEHRPGPMLQSARRAEEIGFEILTISDHFHPWTRQQGESPFAWSVVGVIAEATERIGVGTAVTCPTVRTHPAGSMAKTQIKVWHVNHLGCSYTLTGTLSASGTA